MKTTFIALLVAAASFSASAVKADVFNVVASAPHVNENGPGYAQPVGNISTFSQSGITYTNIGTPNLSQIKTAPSDGNGAVPFNAVGINYISVLGGGRLSLSFADTKSLGFYWGSIDSYNTIEFFNDGFSVGSFTGSNAALLASLTANGDQGSYNSNRFVTFTDNSGVFDQVKISSSANSFEFFNVQAVPEASTWAMMILGFLGLGFFGYRKSAPGSAFRMV